MKTRSGFYTSYIIYLVVFLLVFIRFVKIDSIPIFGDEALYLSLADKILKDPRAIFDSIPYGVFPILIWIQAVVLMITKGSANPFIAGRILSISFDIAAAIIVYFIGKDLYDKKTGLFAVIIYLSLPLTFFHTRFFLLDSLTNLIVLAAVYVSIRGLKYGILNRINLSWIFMSAFLLVASFFTKPLAVVSFGAIATTPVLFMIRGKVKNLRKFFWPFLNFFCSFVLATLFIALLYLPVSDQFNNRFVSDSNNSFVLSITHFKVNLWRSIWWVNNYLTLPVIFLVIISVFFSALRRWWTMLWFAGWAGMVVLLDSYFSAHFYPRHLLPVAAPVALITGSFFAKFYKLHFIFLFLFFTVTVALWNLNLKILFTPQSAPIALEDKQQFFEDWTSGVGNIEIAKEIKRYSNGKKVAVFVEEGANQYWSFVNLYDFGGATVYPSKELAGGEFIKLDQLQSAESKQDVYIVLNRNPQAPDNWPVTLVYQTPKGPNRTINIYKVIATQ